MNTIVRCFRKIGKGDLRRGVWIFTEPNGPRKYRGAFFHGSYNEIEAPDDDVDGMVEDTEDGELCDEITPEEALQELEGWPEGQQVMQAAFDRHSVVKEASQKIIHQLFGVNPYEHTTAYVCPIWPVSVITVEDSGVLVLALVEIVVIDRIEELTAENERLYKCQSELLIEVWEQRLRESEFHKELNTKMDQIESSLKSKLAVLDAYTLTHDQNGE